MALDSSFLNEAGKEQKRENRGKMTNMSFSYLLSGGVQVQANGKHGRNGQNRLRFQKDDISETRFI